jgi:flagellar hook-length control protein FliK
MAQVQRGLASIMNTKGGSMKIRLSPEHLGEVNIQLSTKDGHVSVKIEAEHEHTTKVLKEGLDGLRQAIESRGASVDELTVDARNRTGFSQILGDPGQSGETGDQPRHGQQDSEHKSSSNSSIQHAQAHAEDDEHRQTPQGIWTELGLDAIA